MIRFQDALETAKNFASEWFAQHEKVYVIRDLVGRVSLALDVSDRDLPNKSALSAELDGLLGAFGPGAGEAVQSRDDLLMPDEVFRSDELIRLADDPIEIHLVDRLMNNQDWLRRPLVDTAPLPTAVAFSLKGGVGRSTTFAAWAHHLAAQGNKVLAVDLDLEAPGLQSLLLGADADPRRDRLPNYGVVDWLVEGRVGQADESLFEQMLGRVALAPGIPGEIQVIPAFGGETRDYVAKLGRAYLSTIDPAGREYGFSEAVLALLRMAADRAEPFDLALMDARAGMHDIGAAAVTRLGAHAFLFARDDAPTWSAYAHLFDHLRWSPAIEHGMRDDDLRWRLSTVGAMAGGTREAMVSLQERSYETWLSLFDEEPEDAVSVGTPELNDQGSPHWPLPVYAVSELRDASFHDPEYAPQSAVLERAYQAFFQIADERLSSGLDGGVA